MKYNVYNVVTRYDNGLLNIFTVLFLWDLFVNFADYSN